VVRELLLVSGKLSPFTKNAVFLVRNVLEERRRI